jgi:hypothetical protein
VPSPATISAPIDADAIVRASPWKAQRAWARCGAFVRDRWLSIDYRTLGLFRIGFGLCLIANLFEHMIGGNLVAFYSNDGVLTNHFALFKPIQPRAWSLLFAFSRPGEVWVAFLAMLAVYVLYTLGYKTRLMQLLVIVCIVSLTNRNLLLQDGGYFASTVLSTWTLLLPLGARLSLDRWLVARKGGVPSADEAPRHVSFVCLALFLQLAFIYGFNAANKTGDTWRNGSAVHYILWQSSTNTRLAGFLRFHESSWFSPLLTKATLLFEWAAPVLALTPVVQTWARRILAASMVCFHIGIAALMSLGPFAYVMMAYGLLLVGPRDWPVLEALGRKCGGAVARAVARHPRLRALLDPADLGEAAERPRSATSSSPWKRPLLREGAAMLLFAAVVSELSLANPAVPARLRLEHRPSWMAETLHYLRIYQTWGMFSADPPLTDGLIVVDALLADGTHVDPLTGAPPDFEAPLHGPWLRGHDWSEYMLYYPWDRHRVYRDGLRDYVIGLEKRAGLPPEKRLRSLEIYSITAHCPPPGSLVPYDIEKKLLLSHLVRD